MNDIAFIIRSDDFEDESLSSTINTIAAILYYSTAISIIIFNRNNNSEIINLISSCEKKWPDNILIIYTEDSVGYDECLDISLKYSESYCYVHVIEPLYYLSPDFFDGLAFISGKCDIDRYKYIKDKYSYISLSMEKQAFPFEQINEMPLLSDYRNNAGSVDPYYFFQDIYVASKIREAGITHVFDIGSRLDGYISHLLAMNIDVTMIDIRPLSVKIDNLSFMEGDATNLSNIRSGSIPILSCLHALEHFGLGRYGDTIDPDGWCKALAAYKRIIALDGHLFLSVPVGRRETLVFNAHRIFDPITIVSNLLPTFSLIEFTLFHDCQKSTFDFSRCSHDTDIFSIFKDISCNLLGDNDCGIFIMKKA